jgi:signal transduction histidine kinase
MNPRVKSLAIDAGIVAALVAATVVFIRGPHSWLYLFPTEGDLTKISPEIWRTALINWWTASGIGVAAMLARSWKPMLALVGTLVMAVGHITSHIIPLLPIDLAVAFALYAVAATDVRRRVSYLGLGLGLAVSLFAVIWGFMSPPVFGPTATVLPPSAVLVAWLAGDRLRARQEQDKQRERERLAEAELAVADERGRIARDMHDAVAHGLSIMVIQAQAAIGALERRPATALAALKAIETTGRHSLGEMRRLLGLSRPEETQLVPLPGIADLTALADRVRQAGLAVSLEVTGAPGRLPGGVAASVYRIVQEALTNALKHAGPRANALVSVHCGQDLLEVVVADTGRGAGGAPAESRGNGLRGMRQRVELLGGSFGAADAVAGGFEVRARIPVTLP